MLNMALLLCVVNEGEHVVINQVVEEVNPSVEVGLIPVERLRNLIIPTTKASP